MIHGLHIYVESFLADRLMQSHRKRGLGCQKTYYRIRTRLRRVLVGKYSGRRYLHKRMHYLIEENA